jgi:hypothetical protein
MAELEKQKSAIGNAELAQRFVQFVMMQAQNIFYVLGRIPSQDGRPIPPNLEAAKILVDQLEMIQEKTRGNLSAQESSILNDALKNVRLAFVEASGGTPASMMPKSSLSNFPLDGEDDFTGAEPPARPAEKPKPAATSSAAPAPASPPPAAPEPENKKKFSKTYG